MKEDIYELITEDDERACDNLPDTACKEVPGNFFLNTFNGAGTKLAEQIASPSLVLPWFLAALGAPATLTGFLVPVSRGGSLLPQLAVSAKIRAFEVRKWFWVGAGTVQFLALLLMALTAVLFTGKTAGIMVLFLLLLFSMASGVGSVSFKDVLAKTIPKGKRGTLLSLRALLGGLLALAAGVMLNLYVAREEEVSLYVILLVIAAFLWLVAAILFALIKEFSGETSGGRSAIKEAKAGWDLLKEQPAFLRFVTARSLLLSVMLVIPFYSIFAREVTGTAISSLGIYVIANSMAMVLSSYFWGRFSDRSSRSVLVAGGIIALLTALMALSFPLFPENWQTPVTFSLVFFFAGIAHSGIRLGRKTYLVDGAPEKDRPLYVSVSNTVVGFITLTSVILGPVADIFSTAWLIVVFMVLMLSGVIVAFLLPESKDMVKQ